MSFPLSFWDISLWLAITAVILLITSQLLAPYYGKTDVRISKKKLRNVAFAVSFLFLATIVIIIISTLIAP